MTRNPAVVLAGFLAIVLALGAFSPLARGGVFAFAEVLQNPQVITHPSGYTGHEGVVEVSVCIEPESESKSELEIAIHNSIHRWNGLAPEIGNSSMAPASGVPTSKVDAESVLLHEMGHCLGLAHPNLGSESGLEGEQRRFAKSLKGGGPDNGYTLDAGIDGVIASHADHRHSDTNLHWFRKADNDPFAIGDQVDATTYSTDLADLPDGHEFPTVAGAQVSAQRGMPRSEAVMHQGIFFGEKRTALGHDDVAMIRLGMAGTDRSQGTETDYELKLVYVGVQSDCDIRVRMAGPSFAYCSASGAQVADNHWRVTSAQIRLGSNALINWHFNTERLGDRMFSDGFGGN